MAKITLMVGVTGQDDEHLIEFLLEKRYIVLGVKIYLSPLSSFNAKRIAKKIVKRIAERIDYIYKNINIIMLIFHAFRFDYIQWSR